MDTLKSHLFIRLRGSTMVEVLVALAIISCVLGIAYASLGGMGRASMASRYFREMELRSLAEQEKLNPLMESHQLTLADSLPVWVEWLPYEQGGQKLKLLQISVDMPQGGVVTYREIIYIDHADEP